MKVRTQGLKKMACELKEQVPGGSQEVNWSELLPWEINLLNSGYCCTDRIWEAVLKQVTTHLSHTQAHAC